jgi:hypothetical protein
MLLLELEQRVKIPAATGKRNPTLIKAWATDLISIRDQLAHDNENFPVDDAIRALDLLERLIDLLSGDAGAVLSIRDMRHDLIQTYAASLSRNGSFSGRALAELAERMSTYHETRDPEDLAKRELTGRLLPMARQQILNEDEILFLLRSATYDAQRLRDYARLTIDFPGVSTLLADWLSLGSVRPKYRLACCLQFWSATVRREVVDDAEKAARVGKAADRSLAGRLLDAIEAGRVDQFIEDPEQSSDLNESQRADLLRTVVTPLREEFPRTG